MRVFGQSKEFMDKEVDIDNGVIVAAIWIMQKQSRDGSFPQIGNLHHKAMQVSNKKKLEEDSFQDPMLSIVYIQAYISQTLQYCSLNAQIINTSENISSVLNAKF